MKKKTLILASVLGVAAIAFAAKTDRVQLVEAADHLDGQAVQAAGNVPADITDFYAWMWDDGGTQSVAMIIGANPVAMSATAFPQNVHYVVNIDRGGTETKVICQFESDDNTAIRCWVGDETTNTVISGDPSDDLVPLESDGVKVFAGLRKDPFTFNLAGFGATMGYVNANNADAGLFPPDGAFPGCFGLINANPAANPANGIDTMGEALQNCLSTACNIEPGSAGNTSPPTDFFAPLNVLALTISVPLADIPGTGDTISAYASTHSR